MRKNTPLHQQLSRRERQIMDIVYAAKEASVNEVRDALPDPPSYSAVRASMRVLEEKGFLRHKTDAARYVYLPVESRQQVGPKMMQQILHSFFGGSVEAAVTTLLSAGETKLTAEEYDRLAALIEQAKEEGR